MNLTKNPRSYFLVKKKKKNLPVVQINGVVLTELLILNFV